MTVPLSHWVVFLIVCVIVAWIDRRLRAGLARVQTAATPSPSAPLLPPEGNWCGCCGRPAPEPWLWCDDCLFHVALGSEAPHERTWYAQHGTICPFTDLDDGDTAPEGVAPRRPAVDGEFRPSGPQQRILNALRWLETIGVGAGDKTQVALLADQSPTSSSYTNNVGALRTAGLIDYPGPRTVGLTDGRADATGARRVGAAELKLSRCRSCGEPILWTITTNGKHMPVDAEPVVASRGFRIDETLLDEAQMGFNDGDLKPGKDLLATFTAAPAHGELLFVSHFSSCPNADAHRR